MALDPTGNITPRRPPVPNGITVQNTSSSFFQPAGSTPAASTRRASSAANSP